MKFFQGGFVVLGIIGSCARSIPMIQGAVVTYQAEDATLGACKLLSRHDGYDGAGYADFENYGSYLAWSIDALVTGDHKITVRYATKINRPLELSVDGAKKGVFALDGTGDWKNWATETMVVFLSQGSHIVKLLAQLSPGPNVDWLSIGSSVESPVSSPTQAPNPIISPTQAPNPISSETLYYEAEDALTNNVQILTIHPGYAGTGYADFQGFNAHVLWMVTAPATSDYEISVRFAASNSRPADLMIDGVTRVTFVFEGRGSWSSWGTETVVLPLTGGSHTLKVIAITNPGPNIDWLSIRLCVDDCGVVSPTTAPAASGSPVQGPTPSPPSSFPERIVLDSNQHLDRDQFVFSPNGKYKVGLTSAGDFVLQDKNSRTIWQAGISNGFRCYMQPDGNLIVRQSDKKALWTSNTYDNPGAHLIVDDGGRIAVMHGSLPLWLDGFPRGQYNGPSSRSLDFPIRGVFYYPWYPETWTVNGKQAKFEPDLGFYSSSDPDVAENHIDAFEYANVDLSIASWWGPDTNLDRARLTMLMDKTIAMDSNVKWSVYHEDERDFRPSANEIRKDLDYLKQWFAWHPAWAHVDNRPVIFVFNEGGCDVVNRWMDASNGDWYVVLKLFKDFTKCPTQPSSWHQYGVGTGALQYENHSFTIAPGFWRADSSTPKLPRVGQSIWCENVRKMVESREPWQLIVTFNEAGEGTMIEASSAWRSNTKYGYYLDCLHKYVS